MHSSFLPKKLCTQQIITPKTSHNRTVENLDIERYMGKWYEIARNENFFERDLVKVTANYSLLPDNTVAHQRIQSWQIDIYLIEGKDKDTGPAAG